MADQEAVDQTKLNQVNSVSDLGPGSPSKPTMQDIPSVPPGITASDVAVAFDAPEPEAVKAASKDTAVLMNAWGGPDNGKPNMEPLNANDTTENANEQDQEQEQEPGNDNNDNEDNNDNHEIVYNNDNENKDNNDNNDDKENENDKEEEKGGDNDGAPLNISTDDEEKVIRLGAIIPNYKQWLQDNPREVYCAATMTLLTVDLVTQTFEVELECHLFWKQPQLRKYIGEDETWKLYDDQYAIPVDLDDPFDGDLALEWIEQEYDYDHETGVVDMLLHMKDQFAERMELERFPADRQFLNIKLMGRAGEEEGNWIWITGEKNDVPDWVPEEYHGRNQLQARLGPAVADYTMEDPWADFNILQTPKPGYEHCLDEQPPFKLRFRVERLPGFYVGSIIVPMVLIIVCCYSSLCVPRGDIADRLSVSITLMLATVAFKFVTSTILPPISYLTWMDYYMTTMFVVIGLFVLNNAISKTVSESFEQFDFIFGCVVFAILVGGTGFMIFALYTNQMRLDWLDMDREDRSSDDDDFVGAEVRTDINEGKTTIMVLGPANAAEAAADQEAAEAKWNEWKAKQA